MEKQKETPVAAGVLNDAGCSNNEQCNYTPYQNAALQQGYEPRTVNLDMVDLAVPSTLHNRKQWIVWQYQPDPGKDKPKKMPMRFSGRRFSKGSSTDATTYLSFEDALVLYRDHVQLDGIGFALTDDDPFTVVDLDSCFNTESGVEPWAKEKIEAARSWTELTPSKKGFHIIVEANVPGMKSKASKYHDAKLELYRTGRFFTVTGNTLDEHLDHLKVVDGQAFIESENKAIQDAQGGTKQKSKVQPQVQGLRSVQDVLGVIAAVAGKQGKGQAGADKFMRLHNEGFISEDQSADDQSYMNIAAFYTAKNPELMRELYMQSALVREKSDREDYVQRTIDKAIADTKNVFKDTAVPKAWPDIVDPFDEYVTRAFPMDIIPKVLKEYCEQVSQQSGFDKGAYAFCFVGAASALIDHTAKIDLKIMRQPSITWFALVSPSGGGKSPVMNTAMKPIRTVHDAQAQASKDAIGRWKRACKTAKDNGEVPPPKPAWRQTIVQDTTVEALADACTDNPKGVIYYADELTGFIGQMDAYGGKNHGSKDRGVYLSAFDGGSKTINRKNQQHPVVVDNLSLSILSGVQPEKLAEMYSQRGGGSSDGLFQRFLVYAMKQQQDVDYTAEVNPFTETSVTNMFKRLDQWKECGFYQDRGVYLEREALGRLQEYHNAMRTISQRTASPRQAEHYNKFPGYVGRLAVVLHFLKCASDGDYAERVTRATLDDAINLLGVLFSHSDAVYQVIEKQSGGAGELMRSAAEAILSKKWTEFKRGDLTRDATGWREEKDRNKTENALDLLIEFGWIADVTPPPMEGKRGRRSDGVFAVNPDVHTKYKQKAERIVEMRKERFEAIKKAGAERAG